MALPPPIPKTETVSIPAPRLQESIVLELLSGGCPGRTTKAPDDVLCRLWGTSCDVGSAANWGRGSGRLGQFSGLKSPDSRLYLCDLGTSPELGRFGGRALVTSYETRILRVTEAYDQVDFTIVVNVGSLQTIGLLSSTEQAIERENRIREVHLRVIVTISSNKTTHAGRRQPRYLSSVGHRR